MNHAWKTTKSLFISGLLTLLPIGITLYIFKLLFNLVFFWLAPLREILPLFLHKIPFIELWIALIGILAVGFISKIFVLKRVLHIIEEAFLKTPFIKPIYSGIKQVIDGFVHTQKQNNQDVALVEFPQKGSYALGFITGKVPAKLAPTEEQQYISVFVPTAPNPTAGFVFILSEQQIIRTTLSRQEAISIIISGGMIQPQKTN